MKTLMIKLQSLMSRGYRFILRKDNSPETIIHNICDEIDSKLEALGDAAMALHNRQNENNQLIDTLHLENGAMEEQRIRANNLRQGLNKLLQGE